MGLLIVKGLGIVLGFAVGIVGIIIIWNVAVHFFLELIKKGQIYSYHHFGNEYVSNGVEDGQDAFETNMREEQEREAFWFSEPENDGKTQSDYDNWLK